MITVTVKHETSNSDEQGYGIYVNAYVTWDDDIDSIPVLYASECVPFGKRNAPDALKAAGYRVKAIATTRAKLEFVG